MTSLPTLNIVSRIKIIGVNPYVSIGAKQASLLKKNWRGPMPVRYQVNGKSAKTWRINMMPLGDGRYRLHLNGEVRKETGLVVGDAPSLRIQFDEEYRGGPQHQMPSWFSDELNKNPQANGAWKRLPPSRQKEILRYFSRLKSEEALQRNVRRALSVLAGETARFMGRAWNEDRNPRRPRTKLRG